MAPYRLHQRRVEARTPEMLVGCQVVNADDLRVPGHEIDELGRVAAIPPLQQVELETPGKPLDCLLGDRAVPERAERQVRVAARGAENEPALKWVVSSNVLYQLRVR